MATDIEESDTDDHERPAPPKRQCTRILDKANETIWDTEKSLNKQEEKTQETGDVEYDDDAEKQLNEKLKRWQACQEAKGYVDNTINIVLENYMYSLEESRFHLLGRNDMEDTAVMMAILNHGLSAGIVSQSRACCSEKAPGYGTNKNFRCSCPSNGVQESLENVATTSSGSLRLNDSESTEEHTKLEWDLDKIDENDQQENILERAVAEAIKKKGLSALSVDYG